MPRYFFHLNAPSRVVYDLEGAELPTLSEAKFEIEVLARELLAAQIKSGGMLDDLIVFICDERGEPLMTVKGQVDVQLSSHFGSAE